VRASRKREELAVPSSLQALNPVRESYSAGIRRIYVPLISASLSGLLKENQSPLAVQLSLSRIENYPREDTANHLPYDHRANNRYRGTGSSSGNACYVSYLTRAIYNASCPDSEPDTE